MHSTAFLTLALLACLGMSSRALAQDTLRADNVADVAGAAWDARWGGAYHTRAEGARQAADQVPTRWTQLTIGLEPGTVIASPDQGDADQVLGADVSFILGDAQSRRRDHWDALAAATDARADADRARFVLAAEDAYITWATEALVAEHLAEDLEAYRAELSALEPGVASAAISRLDWLDLQADVARLAMEVLDAEQRVTDSARDLAQLVAGAPELGTATLDDAFGEPNPWRDLAGRAHLHPEAVALQSDAEALRLEADATSVNPMTLTAGPVVHHEANGLTWIAGTVGIAIPLSNPGLAQAEALRSEALALESDRDAMAHTLSTLINAEATRHDTLVTHLQTLTNDHLALLEEREALVIAGLAQGHATVEQVIRARRERHEAEHHRILVLAELYRSFALARHYAHLLAPETP